MDIELTSILNLIHRGGYEIDVYTYLTTYMVTKLEALESSNATLSAQLKAVKKINKGRNAAIDALCEED